MPEYSKYHSPMPANNILNLTALFRIEWQFSPLNGDALNDGPRLRGFLSVLLGFPGQQVEMVLKLSR